MVETKINTKGYLNIYVIRKEKELTKKAFEGQERLSKVDHGQQQKPRKKKKGRRHRESQRVLLQVCTLSGDEN